VGGDIQTVSVEEAARCIYCDIWRRTRTLASL